MPIERGNLEHCLERTVHHADPTSFMILDKHGVRRVNGIKNGVVVALEQVEKIRKEATRCGYQRVTDLLNENLEFDWTK